MDGRCVLVFGAASGIGRGIAARFAALGAAVVLADVRGDEAREVAAEIGGNAHGLTCDVTVAEQVEQAVTTTVDTLGRLDVLVYSAGNDYFGPIIGHPEEEYDRLMSVNMKGAFLAMKYGAAAMAESGGGSIINLSSIAGFGGLASHSAYSAAKAGTISLTRSAAVELRSLGIRANVICPGAVDTPMLDEARERFHRTQGRTIEEFASQSQGRLGTVDDVAGLAVFLASEQASFVNGAVLAADGGATAKAF